MALVIDIADAVAAELAGGTFSEEFTPQRQVLPDFELADLAGLKVTVVPKGVETAGASRSLCQSDVQIDVGVQKKVGTDLDGEVAALCGLVEEIADFLKRRPLAEATTAAWVSAEQHALADQIAADKHLASKAAAQGKGLGIKLVKLSPGGTA